MAALGLPTVLIYGSAFVLFKKASTARLNKPAKFRRIQKLRDFWTTEVYTNRYSRLIRLSWRGVGQEFIIELVENAGDIGGRTIGKSHEPSPNALRTGVKSD